jgi:RNA polymerase sigma-70 factor, ECF subfamily
LEKEFINIISAHQGVILKVCRMYCNDREDSEDLFQEIVLQLWRSYPAFRGDAKLSTWIYRIGLNMAITRLREQLRKPVTLPISMEHQNFTEMSSQRMDVEYGTELLAAIDTLNKFDKALLLLYLDEKSYKEIAEIIGLSESNVGVKINRIKRRLKEMIRVRT